MKILLGLLSLGAFASLSYAFSALHSSPDAALGASIGTVVHTVDSCSRDTDKDGLSDCEETYWNTDFQKADTDGDGFVDGEEVLSGHSPAKKGPNDFLNNHGNVTQQAATLLIGAATVGDLDPSSPNYQNSIAAYSQAVVDRYQANSEMSDENVTVGTDRTVDIINYGITGSAIIGPALQNASTSLIPVVKVIADLNLDALSQLKTTDPTKYQEFIAAINTQIGALDGPILKLQKMTVPPSMVVGHKNVLVLLRGIQQQYRLVHQISQDPVQAMFALQTLQTFTQVNTADVAQDFAIRLNRALTQ